MEMTASTDEKRTLSLLGLAAKAGKVASGEFAAEKSVKSQRACLVLLAEDASENTKKKFINMCDFYEVDLRSFMDKETLGKAIGKDLRSCLTVEDPGFARQLHKLLDPYARADK